MTRNSYPEEIYTTETGATITSPKKRRMVEKAYTLGTLRSGTTCQDLDKAYDAGFERGKHHKDNLTGFSNLTEAIKAGERIDWDALDGVEAKCFHPEIGTLTYTMKRDQPEPANTLHGWNTRESIVWEWAFELAWQNTAGWALWVKGDLPLRKQTADQLEPGTCFKGMYASRIATYFVFIDHEGEKNAYHMTWGESCDPTEIEVVEVYGTGTFQTPKEDA
ncbi:hypothetical protein E4U03_04775 [Rothia nasimurium]|uniref:Uncharacterized protein n=1 Tax=Rothia nasimurium TaxID=85336 RepID=A0A4Y9F4C1_9MICC|nr:hypothetical protein [Rothia nasimurium]MBF0807932.1 hypothetical protein [Rothia nasimurium]TFU22933.1 hypothetical protein E4U03_04775 [Rothia nasimurium]